MKKNKKDNLVKIFLTVFLFVFLFVNFGEIATPKTLAQMTDAEKESAANADSNSAWTPGENKYVTPEGAKTQVPESMISNKAPAGCPWITKPHICMAQSILPIMSGLNALAVTLLTWAVAPAKTNSILGDSNGGIYLAWKNVRDFLNIAFILFLLFSAFCTVFQVSKYSYKSILLNLVLMAFLVNFSFPITRFIIDVSNVLMYTMLNELFTGGTGNSIAGNFANMSQIAKIVAPETAGFVQLVMANIFLFILAITFLIMALLFIIRIIALAILIIFSPLAFTGSVIPGLQDKASSWWKHLFNYSFFGPIMVFMIYIAFSLSAAMSTEMSASINSAASKASNDPSWIVNLCKFVIPIIILWMGMGIAKGMSIAGAGTITDFAQNKLKGMGKSLSGMNWAQKQWGDYKKERDARKEESRWKAGKNFGNNVNNAQDSILATLGSTKAQKRMDKRRTDKNKKDIDDGAKGLVDGGATTDTLAQQMNTHFGSTATLKSSDKIDQAKSAAAYLRQSSDERKMHAQNTLASGIAGSDLEHILNASAPANLIHGSPAHNYYLREQTKAQTAAAAIAGGSTNENDIRTVTGFVQSQMKRRVDAGANA